MSILSISRLTSPYPETNSERDKWILERRPARETLDPHKPYLFFVEQELSASGEILPVATIFLTNRECPWRCVMCDLWRNTLTTSRSTRRNSRTDRFRLIATSCGPRTEALQ